MASLRQKNRHLQALLVWAGVESNAPDQAIVNAARTIAQRLDGTPAKR